MSTGLVTMPFDALAHVLRFLGGMLFFVIAGIAFRGGFSIVWGTAYGLIAVVVGACVIYLVEPRASHMSIGELVVGVFCWDAVYLVVLIVDSYVNGLSTPGAIAFDLAIWWLSPWLGLLTIFAIFRFIQINRGRRWSGRVRPSRAILALSLLVVLAITFIDVLKPSSVGALYAWIGEREKAVTALTTAIEWQPNDSDSYLNRAVVYAELGKAQPAIDDASKAIDLGPSGADAYLIRGAANEMLGNTVQADADFKRCLELQPNWSAKVQSYRRQVKDWIAAKP